MIYLVNEVSSSGTTLVSKSGACEKSYLTRVFEHKTSLAPVSGLKCLV